MPGWTVLRSFGAGTGSLTVEETPSGTLNGTNVTFTLTYTPAAATLELELNGVFQRPGVDYTLAAATITYTVPPIATDTHTARYAH